MTLANQLTLVRIVLIPLLVLVFLLPVWWSFPLSSAIFGIAALTDWLDGYVARRYEQSTPFGAFLDPVADKLMVAVALVLLVGEHASAWMTVPAAVIIGREIVISALREWMAELGKRASVAVSYIGKIKTTFQMIAILILLFFDPQRFPSWTILGYLTLYGAAILTLWSMIIYMKAAWPVLMNADAEEQAGSGD